MTTALPMAELPITEPTIAHGCRLKRGAGRPKGVLTPLHVFVLRTTLELGGARLIDVYNEVMVIRGPYVFYSQIAGLMSMFVERGLLIRVKSPQSGETSKGEDKQEKRFTYRITKLGIDAMDEGIRLNRELLGI